MFTKLNEEVSKEATLDSSLAVLLNGIADRLDAVASDRDLVLKTATKVRQSAAEFLQALKTNVEVPLEVESQVDPSEVEPEVAIEVKVDE